MRVLHIDAPTPLTADQEAAVRECIEQHEGSGGYPPDLLARLPVTRVAVMTALDAAAPLINVVVFEATPPDAAARKVTVNHGPFEDGTAIYYGGVLPPEQDDGGDLEMIQTRIREALDTLHETIDADYLVRENFEMFTFFDAETDEEVTAWRVACRPR